MSFVKDAKNEIIESGQSSGTLDFLQEPKTEKQIRNYIKAMFLLYASGGINNKYHIQFSKSGFLPHLLAQFDVFAKQSGDTVYIKEADSISNLLSLVGAHNAVLELNNRMAFRDLRRDVNRKANAESANIGRQVVASVNQIAALKRMDLTRLPLVLQEAAKARIANPQMSLEELAAKLGITKSCLNHRLRAILNK